MNTDREIPVIIPRAIWDRLSSDAKISLDQLTHSRVLPQFMLFKLIIVEDNDLQALCNHGIILQDYIKLSKTTKELSELRELKNSIYKIKEILK